MSPHFSAQQLSLFYTGVFCSFGACALVVYDWCLCLNLEIRFIWEWRSRVTLSSLLYVFSRYGMVVQAILTIASNLPMSDLSCRENAWTQDAMVTLSLLAFVSFSALRAYALSNKNIWLVVLIVLSAIPPIAMHAVKCVYMSPKVLPSPFNCSASTSLSPTLSLSVLVVARASQLAGELIVIGITWWYTYQSYRIRKISNSSSATVSSLLVSNGSVYFFILATLCVLDIICNAASVPPAMVFFVEAFVDPISSILVCRFVLSLRQFDSTVDATDTGSGSRVRQHMASTMLQFAAQPSSSLPAAITSFAHPVHVDSNTFLPEDSEGLFESESQSEGREMGVEVGVLEPPSGQDTTADSQPTEA